jgi:PD-(D/E)XK nuclease superfamily
MAQRLVKRDAGGFYIRILLTGQPTAVLKYPYHNTIVRLFPERTYADTKDQLHNISYRQIPDVAVEIQQSKSPPRLYLFDPKYKLNGELLEGESPDGRPKKMDIDKMHAYRDAIRDQEDRRVVRHAAILYPGPSISYGEGIEALHAYPGSVKILEERLQELFQQALTELT